MAQHAAKGAAELSPLGEHHGLAGLENDFAVAEAPPAPDSRMLAGARRRWQT
jgi:hypothetical protein